MIRRDVQSEVWLIRQSDHAAVAGELARHAGGAVARPEPFEPWARAVALHDAGWAGADDAPALDSRRRPLDALDAPPAACLPAWKRSADCATAAGGWTGLLVSLHVLHLSALLVSKQSPAERADPHARFALNKFQHAEFERQELLRPPLGLSNDRPLRLGLAEPNTEAWDVPAERSLLFALRLLTAMDALSVAICRGTAGSIKSVFSGPDLRPAPLTVRRPAAGRVEVAPFPFDAPLTVAVPYRRLKATAFAGVEEFRERYATAPVETLDVRVVPG